ncbi:MAG: TerB family tellurite resistance protein [Schleiferiaceae bacterium]|jgi:uncharacterized tellurite resistance protein B-like protein|nr:TerB family tellurite resistance protein [Schleiferiaceae bacterium]
MTGISEIKSYDDYKSFIMICAASSDFNISEEEHDFIVQTIPEERYQTLKRIADRCSDFECINIIAEHKNEYIKSPDEKKELMKEILELFNADHNFSTLERNMLLALKRML